MNILAEWTQKARSGGQVTINGEQYTIAEVVSYHHGAEKWVNIVTHDTNGREIALEAVKGEDELTLWQRIPKIRNLVGNPADTIRYKGETFSLEEKGTARAIVETAKRTEAATVPYWVFLAESGRSIAVEIWDSQFYCYVAETSSPQVSF